MCSVYNQSSINNEVKSSPLMTYPNSWVSVTYSVALDSKLWQTMDVKIEVDLSVKYEDDEEV